MLGRLPDNLPGKRDESCSVSPWPVGPQGKREIMPHKKDKNHDIVPVIYNMHFSKYIERKVSCQLALPPLQSHFVCRNS